MPFIDEKDVVWKTPKTGRIISEKEVVRTPAPSMELPALQSIGGTAPASIPLEQPPVVPEYEIDRSGVKQFASKIQRPVLESLGMVGGTIAGLPLAPETLGLSVPAGVGLGYAGGSQVANKIDELLGLRQQQPLPEELKGAAKDVLTGVEAELIGQTGAAGLSKLFKAIPKKAPQKIVERSFKPSTTLSDAQREKQIETLLGEKLNLNQKSIVKLQDTVSAIKNQVDDIISQAAESGQKISTKKIVSGLDDLAQTFKDHATPKKFIAKINSFKQQILKEHGDTIPIDKAQRMKRLMQKEAQAVFERSRRIDPGLSSLESQIDANVADGLMRAIEEELPAVSALNKRSSALLGLRKTLVQSVNRIRNRNFLSLGDILPTGAGLGVGGTEGAVIGFVGKKVLGDPRVQVAIARTLRNARALEIAPGAAIKTMALETAKRDRSSPLERVFGGRQ